MAKKPEKPKTPEEQAYLKDEAIEEAVQDYSSYVNARAAALWSYEDTGHDLTMEEQLFCRSYIIDRNPVAALQRLRHEGSADVLKRRAAKYLSNPEVADCIDELAKRLMDKLSITAEKVQARIAAVAFFDPRSVMEFDRFGVNLLNSRFWSADQAANIQSIKNGPMGLELKFYDSLRATEMLAKQLGVQPEDSDPAEAARIGAEQAVSRIVSFFDKVINDPEPPPALEHIPQEDIVKH